MEPEEQFSSPQPVVVVLVTHDAPAERFSQVLHALVAQDHPNLDVLVVDTGTVDPTERVHAVLPAAKIHRIGDTGADGDPEGERAGPERHRRRIGFGAAANVVLDLVSGAEFYVFCHDDAAPDRRAVSEMVAAAEMFLSEPHRAFPVLRSGQIIGLLRREDVLGRLLELG